MDGRQGICTMTVGPECEEVDHETQAFLDLYVDENGVYSPSVVVDPAGDAEIHQRLEKVAAQEAELLHEILSVRFRG